MELKVYKEVPPSTPIKGRGHFLELSFCNRQFSVVKRAGLVRNKVTCSANRRIRPLSDSIERDLPWTEHSKEVSIESQEEIWPPMVSSREMKLIMTRPIWTILINNIAQFLTNNRSGSRLLPERASGALPDRTTSEILGIQGTSTDEKINTRRARISMTSMRSTDIDETMT